jgi:hypothetical protein
VNECPLCSTRLQEANNVSDSFLEMFPTPDYTVVQRDEFITIIRGYHAIIQESHECCLIVTIQSSRRARHKRRGDVGIIRRVIIGIDRTL